MSIAAPSISKSGVTHTASGRIFNFSAGPGCLPEEVLRQIQEDVWNIGGSGIGLLEHSHRGKVFDKILAEAFEDFARIANLPKNYKTLFLTGGATTQNFMVPANLKPQDQVADYITTGYWAEKSLEQAKFYGIVNEAATSKDKNHSYIPDDAQLKCSPNAAYVHMCSNNTIYGTEWNNNDGSFRLPKIPDGVPLVCDMSSDIYSRPVDFSKFGFVYAGAQKNLGAAGTTVCVIREDLLQRKARELPLMLQYAVHAKDESRHNTPPVAAIYICGLVFKWILKQPGGLAGIGTLNLRKANHIYGVIDALPGFYKGHAAKRDRSYMNITFRTPTAELDDKFCKEAGAAGMDGLKGHRATGGMRASTYNAFPEEGCKVMANFMRDFAAKNG